MPDPKIELYQAEWCPYSSLVRQKLTELQLRWTAIPVPASPENRTEMLEATGTDSIPVAVVDGDILNGDAREIIARLGERFEPGPEADEHRRQAIDHGRPVP